jgi:hypothetical protein
MVLEVYRNVYRRFKIRIIDDAVSTFF